jgi:hypothetical protein
MAAKLTRLTHEIAIQLHLVAKSCTICSYRSRRPVRKLLDTPSYMCVCVCVYICVCASIYIYIYNTESFFYFCAGTQFLFVSVVLQFLLLGVLSALLSLYLYEKWNLCRCKSPLGTRVSFLGGKAAGSRSWPLTSIWCRGQECVELYLHSANTPSWCGA